MTRTAAAVGFLEYWHGMHFEKGAFMNCMIRSRLPKKRREHNSAAKNGE
jgi:hypothetical protein